jgi:hypothetical protein
MADDDLDAALEAARARGRELMKHIVLPKQEDYPDLFELLSFPASVYRFLAQHHPEFNGLTGEEAYRTLDRKLVLEVVEGILDGTFS